MTTTDTKDVLSKVPAVTLGFWVIKILATTLGETGGDTVTMTMNWGYLAGSALFLGLLVALIVAQIAAKRFHPLLYWATNIASTTAQLMDIKERAVPNPMGVDGNTAVGSSVAHATPAVMAPSTQA